MPLFIFQPPPESPTKLQVEVVKIPNLIIDEIKPPKNFGVIHMEVPTEFKPLTETSTPCKYVIIKSDKNNTVEIYVANKEQAEWGKGSFLYPGESISFKIDDLSKIYICAPDANQFIDVFYVY